MNTDKRGLKRIGLSVFISVDRRLNMPFRTFSSSLKGGCDRIGHPAKRHSRNQQAA
jgi:hypothetical protein